MKITIEGNTVDGSARSTLNVVLSGARGPAGEPSPLGVPYTGATQDVNLGEFGLLTGNVEFDTTPTNAPTGAGSMSWNDTDGTVNLVLKGGNVISKLGETQHIRAYNNTGTAIARGKVVYVSGAQGQRLTVALADADTEILSKDTIGFTAESIADGAEGFVIIAGVLSNMNTNGMADGATVYLSQTAGGYTTTPPVDPAHLVILGFIVNGGSGGAGSIYVKVDNGYELEELHGVADAAKVTPVGADALLLRDSADNNLWKRLTWTNALAGVKTHMDTFKGVAGGYASLDGSGKIPSTELPSYVDDVVEAASFAALPVTGETGKIYVTLDNNKCYRWSGSVYVEVSQGIDTLTTTGTSGAATLVGSTLNIPQYQSVLTNPVTGTGTAGQVSYWSGTTTQTGSNGFVFDAVNQRVGIGTNAPNYRFQVKSPTGNPIAFFSESDTIAQGGIAIYQTQISSTAGNNLYVTSTGQSLIFENLGNEAARFVGSSRNFVIGTTAASARLHVRGSGTTSATTALLVQNSTPTELFKVLDNGQSTFNNTLSINASGDVLNINSGAIAISQSSGRTGFRIAQPFSSGNSSLNFFTLVNFNHSSGNIDFIRLTSNFSPTSGTGIFENLQIFSTINQTGGANGITRGLYVNPTLTAAADWRSVEFSNNTGWGIYGAGTANNYLGGKLGIGTTSLTYQNFVINRTITGATISTSYELLGNVQSDVTNIASGYSSAIGTQNTVFTLNSLRHVFVQQGTFGASSTVSSQSGFHVNSSLTGATNNYGFYGGLNSGTGRWNLYMEGTASNYLAGNTSIGTTTSSGRLTVQGSGTTSATTALLVQNSGATNLFQITDNGAATLTPTTLTGSEATSALDISQTWNTTGRPFLIKGNVVNTASNAQSSLINLQVGGQERFTVRATDGTIFIGGGVSWRNNSSTAVAASGLTQSGFDFSIENGQTGNARVYTSGIGGALITSIGYSPTSGTGTFTGLTYSGTINQTGGSNGITRGLYVNPTLTAAADWRGIESVAASNANHTLLKLRNATVDVFTVKSDSKIGFFNATPVAQRQTTSGAATLVGGGGTALTDTDTFDGYTLATVVKALRDLGLLA